jgi:hypothetical protein
MSRDFLYKHGCSSMLCFGLDVALKPASGPFLFGLFGSQRGLAALFLLGSAELVRSRLGYGPLPLKPIIQQLHPEHLSQLGNRYQYLSTDTNCFDVTPPQRHVQAIARQR